MNQSIIELIRKHTPDPGKEKIYTGKFPNHQKYLRNERAGELTICNHLIPDKEIHIHLSHHFLISAGPKYLIGTEGTAHYWFYLSANTHLTEFKLLEHTRAVDNQKDHNSSEPRISRILVYSSSGVPRIGKEENLSIRRKWSKEHKVSPSSRRESSAWEFLERIFQQLETEIAQDRER